MMTLQELKLLGEFVGASLQAGLIRTVEGATGAAQCAAILQREVANVMGEEQLARNKAQTELKRLAERGEQALAMEQIPEAQTERGRLRGLCPPSDEASGDLGFGSTSNFENGEAAIPKVG